MKTPLSLILLLSGSMNWFMYAKVLTHAEKVSAACLLYEMQHPDKRISGLAKALKYIIAKLAKTTLENLITGNETGWFADTGELEHLLQLLKDEAGYNEQMLKKLEDEIRSRGNTLDIIIHALIDQHNIQTPNDSAAAYNQASNTTTAGCTSCSNASASNYSNASYPR